MAVAQTAIAEGRSPVDALIDNPWPGGIFHRVNTHVLRKCRELSLPDGTVVRKSAHATTSVRFDPSGAHFGLGEVIFQRFRTTRPIDVEASEARYRALFSVSDTLRAAADHVVSLGLWMTSLQWCRSSPPA